MEYRFRTTLKAYEGRSRKCIQKNNFPDNSVVFQGCVNNFIQKVLCNKGHISGKIAKNVLENVKFWR